MAGPKKARRGSILSDLGVVLAYAGLTAVLARDAKPQEPEFGKSASRGEPIEVHKARAAEDSRGRSATSPAEIPGRGWKEVLWRTLKQIQQDRLLAIAAGVVFYGLLALFPAVTALVSLYGLFTRWEAIHEHVAFLSTVMPEAAVSIINEQITRVLSKGDATLSLGFVLGLGIAIWSANAGMKAMIDALNIVYEETERRNFFVLNLVSLLFTLGALAALLCAIGAIVALPLILDMLGLGQLGSKILSVGRWPALYLGILLVLAILYRYAPNRREPQWKWVSAGSVMASILWIAGSLAFS